MRNQKLQFSALILAVKDISIVTFVFDDENELLTLMGILKCKGFLASIRRNVHILCQSLLSISWKKAFRYQGHGVKLSSQSL